MQKVDYIQHLCEMKMLDLGIQDDKRYVFQLERELANVSVQGIEDYVIALIRSGHKIEHPSLMYYLLGLTSTDPIARGEKPRVKKPASFPDIDTDFSMDERERVVSYFIEKYGKNHVACIGSYGQAKIKMVMRDIARIFDISLDETNEVVKALDEDVDELPEAEFYRLIALGPDEEGFRQDLHDLGRYLDRHPEIKDILFQLKGQLRHLTKHPAGVVAVPGDIDETIPLMRHKGEMVTSWVDGVTRKDLQMSGFVKFDILGLKTLTIIKDILEIIRSTKSYNPDADFDLASIDRGQLISQYYDEFSVKLPVNGNDTIYSRFRDADTNGIFQFECLSGDTWIGCTRLSEIHRRFELGERVLQVSSVNVRTKDRKRQRVVASKMQRKILYRVIIEGNIAIDASADHGFFTKYKWSRLGDLSVGDTVLFDTWRARTQYACECCDEIMDTHGICKSCRSLGKKRSVHIPMRKYKSRYRFLRIRKIIELGDRDCYDIMVESHPHTYLANGFVVHNSHLMKSLLKDIQPTNFSDITASTALARPGPLRMGMHKEFAERKNGKKYEFGHPIVEKCLGETYGIMVYQEDVMRLCNIVAGFPLDETDSIRKNLMKKTRDAENVKKMMKERDDLKNRFVQGCVRNGLTEKAAVDLWDLVVAFASYGFNKSHSVAYTVLSYQMMWFKHYYPLEFMVTLFSHSVKEKFTDYFSEAMNMGIRIKPVDINRATRGFSIHRDDQGSCIMFGLSHIMGVGPAVVDVIEAKKPFSSFRDFIDKTAVVRKIPKQTIEALINAHAFDCFGTQNDIIDEYYRDVREEKKVEIIDGKRVKVPWQRDFDYGDKRFEHEKFVEAYSLDWRVPLEPRHKDLIRSHFRNGRAVGLTGLNDPDKYLNKKVWGIVTEVRNVKSKKGNPYLKITLMDVKFNMAKLRVPLYNRRAKFSFRYNRDTRDYEKVLTEEIIKGHNILVCNVEASEFMDRITVDAYDIYCVGNVYDESDESRARMKDAIGEPGDRELAAVKE